MRLFPLFYNQKRTLSQRFLLFGIFYTIFFTSCVTTKTNYYFKTLKKDTTLHGFVTNDFESKILRKDILAITVSSMNREMDEKFNAAALVAGQVQATIPGYVVNEQGMVTVHYAGGISAAGLTRKELKEKIEQLLLPYFKEPIITVKYLNHKITVLGEVARPQVLNMPEEQISLIDVIVSSGDVKENASRNNIMIIREEKNEKIIKHINLEDHSVFTSPWYYLQPNDIVYVLPDTNKYVKEENRRKLQTNLALAASLASLIVIILNVILR